MPQSIDRLVEPFSGMAAITVAVATEGKASAYWVNDINEHTGSRNGDPANYTRALVMQVNPIHDGK